MSEAIKNAKMQIVNEFAEKIAQLEADGVSVLSSIRVADL